MKIFLLMMTLTGSLYCNPAMESDFAQKYELVFGEQPSKKIWARKKGAPPPRCECCSNLY